MKITQIEKQRKSKTRYNIFLDGQFAFGADEDLIIEKRLIPGKEIEQSDLEEILFEAEVGKLLEKVYRLLGVRMRSEKEIRQKLQTTSYKLQKKGEEPLSEVVIESLIGKLRAKGLVNDLEFAKAWVDSRKRKKSLLVVKGELVQKGVSRKTIEEVLEEALQSSDEFGVASQLMEKKIKTLKQLPEVQAKQKGIQFLMRKGFSFDLSKEVVDKMMKEDV